MWPKSLWAAEKWGVVEWERDRNDFFFVSEFPEWSHWSTELLLHHFYRPPSTLPGFPLRNPKPHFTPYSLHHELADLEKPEDFRVA